MASGKESSSLFASDRERRLWTWTPAVECTQALKPGRVFDHQDILFNFLAALIAVVSGVALSWTRRRRERVRGETDRR